MKNKKENILIINAKTKMEILQKNMNEKILIALLSFRL